MMLRSGVSCNPAIKIVSGIALLLYCIILSVIPLSDLHVEYCEPSTILVSSPECENNDLVVFIHELLSIHLSNAADYHYRAVVRSSHFGMRTDMALPVASDVDRYDALMVLLSLALCLRRYLYHDMTKGSALSLRYFRFLTHSPPLPAD